MEIEKVWIVCHYAQQPPYNTMLRYHNWGKELVKRGFTVTIIAASTVHNTNIDVVKELGCQETVCDGVNYRYIVTPKYEGNGIQRIRNMLSFCFGLRKFRKERPDIIINCEAYLFPFVKHYFRKVPIITDTVDLWPESIVEFANYSKTNPMIIFLYALEKHAYLNSDAMIFSMEGGIDYLKEQAYSDKIDYSRVFHINMGCDIISCDKNLNSFCKKLPWDYSKFNIVYCGSIRQANQVMQICIAADEVQKRGLNDVFFHIYGNGDELGKIKKYAQGHNINNIHFYGRIDKASIPGILANSKANILTYKQVNLMKYGGSQSKLFDYLASGKPILCNAKFGYNLVERFNCGVVTSDQTPQTFADAVEVLYSMTEQELSEMGKRARKVAEAYDQPILVDKLCDVLLYVVTKQQLQ